jgi:hypothetical protein
MRPALFMLFKNDITRLLCIQFLLKNFFSPVPGFFFLLTEKKNAVPGIYFVVTEFIIPATRNNNPVPGKIKWVPAE